MGDHVELQITPETPGRPSIRNPFESPNDYHHLHEPLVPSPSVFKSKPCRATPPKFNWSIDEMASLLPVHIDQEEIQRQSFYLSQTRMDSDIEEKRQLAIDQFFTKATIVPSPWAAPESRRAPQISKKSPLSATTEEAEKSSVACQTTLSLPLAFDLEKILGDYYCYEEAYEAVQESLSSSSLRRKLFLDGQSNYSGSDSSAPPSPDRVHARQERSPSRRDGAPARVERSQGEPVSSVFSSPLSCGMSALTPSTGHFSSSPIQQGCFRDCSLGSIGSPLFPDRSSPAGQVSPTISPILAQVARTPVGSAEMKQPSNVTPHGALLDTVTSCNESPFVEGCSPIRSCSPHQLHYQNEPQHTSRPKLRPRVRCWASPPLISPILNPKLQDNQEVEERPLSTSSSSSPPSMDLDPSSPLGQDSHHTSAERVSLDPMESVKMEEDKEMGMEKRLEDEEEEEEEESGASSGQLTSSRMGNVSATESSHMFVSLLAEGSSIRYDSSMQVDSGYNTTSAGTASLIDGLSSETQTKESLSSNPVEDVFPITRHTKIKVFYPHYCA